MPSAVMLPDPIDDDERINTGRPLETHGCCREYYAECRYFSPHEKGRKQRSPRQWPPFVVDQNNARRMGALIDAVMTADSIKSGLVQRQLRELRIRLRVLDRVGGSF